MLTSAAIVGWCSSTTRDWAVSPTAWRRNHLWVSGSPGAAGWPLGRSLGTSSGNLVSLFVSVGSPLCCGACVAREEETGWAGRGGGVWSAWGTAGLYCPALLPRPQIPRQLPLTGEARWKVKLPPCFLILATGANYLTGPCVTGKVLGNI